MKRIILLLTMLMLIISQTVFAEPKVEKEMIWINMGSMDLVTASKVVIYPLENGDSDINVDTLSLQLGKMGINQAVWSLASTRSAGRTGEELATEQNGNADLIIVPEVIQQFQKEGHSEQIDQYVDMHNREEVEFKGNRRVKYDYHYSERVTVPACSETAYAASFSYLVYNRSGQLVMTYFDTMMSKNGRREMYENITKEFYRDIIPLAIRTLRSRG